MLARLIVTLLSLTYLQTSNASESFYNEEMLNLNEYHAQNAIETSDYQASFVKPKLRYSCDHVRYMLKRYDTTLDEMILSFQSLNATNLESVRRSLDSNKTFKRNFLGLSESHLFENLVEVWLKIPKNSEKYISVMNNFRFGILGIGNAEKDFEVHEKENELQLKVKLNYLDICQEKVLKVIGFKCSDFLDKDCQTSKAYSLDIHELEEEWQKVFWGKKK